MSEYYDGAAYHSSSVQERPRNSLEQREREPHALNLKVLRASRPSLTQNPGIFGNFDKDDSKNPSTSNFTLTPLLSLPTSFGNINLGETFTGVVVAANDSKQDVLDASMRIEMQTASSRVILWETPPIDPNKARILKPGECIEAPLLHHEIREPGQHALTCSVSYWLNAPSSYYVDGQDGQRPDRMGRSFRKLYKFQASNPLSVRTKVHTTKNVAAQLDLRYSDTVYLEVQIQNISPEPLFFEKLSFEPSNGFTHQDLTTQATGLFQPSDILQCLYVLNVQEGFKTDIVGKARQANGVMGLGKLDIRWRGRMGDPGHLTTSTLFRRLPISDLVPPTSRLVPGHAPPQMEGGLSAQSQSPLKYAARTPSPAHSPRVSAGVSSPSNSTSKQFEDRNLQATPDLFAELSVLNLPSDSQCLFKSFDIHFNLRLISTARGDTQGKERRLTLAAQHVDHYHPSGGKRSSSHLTFQEAAGSTTYAAVRPSEETDRPLPPTPNSETVTPTTFTSKAVLPPPYPLPLEHPMYLYARPVRTASDIPSPDVVYQGTSLLTLEPHAITHAQQGSNGSKKTLDGIDGESVRMSTDSSTADDLSLDEVMRRQLAHPKQILDVPFSLSYLALAPGIHKVGGVRILLLEDTWMDDKGERSAASSTNLLPIVLLEHDIIAEVLVE